MFLHCVKKNKAVGILILGILASFLIGAMCFVNIPNQRSSPNALLIVKATNDLKQQYILLDKNKNTYLLTQKDMTSFSTGAVNNTSLYYTQKDSMGIYDIVRYDISKHTSEILPVSDSVSAIDVLKTAQNLIFMRVVKKHEHSSGLIKYNIDTKQYEFFDYNNSDDFLQDFDVSNHFIVEVKYSVNAMNNALNTANVQKAQFVYPEEKISVIDLKNKNVLYSSNFKNSIRAITIDPTGSKFYSISKDDLGNNILTQTNLKSRTSKAFNLNFPSIQSYEQMVFSNKGHLYLLGSTNKGLIDSTGTSYYTETIIDFDILNGSSKVIATTTSGAIKFISNAFCFIKLHDLGTYKKETLLSFGN